MILFLFLMQVELQIIGSFTLVAHCHWMDMLIYFGICLVLIVVFVIIGVFLPRKVSALHRSTLERSKANDLQSPSDGSHASCRSAIYCGVSIFVDRSLLSVAAFNRAYHTAICLSHLADIHYNNLDVCK